MTGVGKLPFGIAWVDVASLAAGALIVGVGAFVLVAKPASWLHRLFFVLALMDGVSSLLFALGLLPGPQRTYFFATYYYHYIAFLALLAVFGLSFPRPLRSRALHAGSTALIVVAALALLAAHALDHALFWTPTPDAPIPARMEPAGNLVNIAFAGIVAALVVRLTFDLRRETSETHRRQGAYVLGGMALAYLPFPATVVAQDLALSGLAPFFEGRWDRLLAHWAYLAAFAALVASALILMRRIAPEARDERRFVLGCYAGVAALALVGFLLPAFELGIALRSLALLAYPALLGFAIMRYEVFDIDRHLRRAATVSIATAALAAAFVVGEEVAANVLGQALGGGFGSAAFATLATAGVFVPVARVSRRVAGRLVPELGHDELHQRKLEIYRHSLAGALADGILKDGESRTLAALRDSLGLTDADHRRVLAEVAA